MARGILTRMGRRGYFAHATAVIDDGAEIGEHTKIWHFCHIMGGARIGDHCVIGQNCFVGNVNIGANVKLQNNVSIYDGVTLEDDVFIGPSAVFTNVINPRSFVARKAEYRATLVGHGATIGANATIVCGVTIGQYAFIGAGAVVTRHVAPYSLVVGVPAVPSGWVCACGIKLGAVSVLEPSAKAQRLECAECGRDYLLRSSGLSPLRPGNQS